MKHIPSFPIPAEAGPLTDLGACKTAVMDIAVVSCSNRHASLGNKVLAAIAHSCYPKVKWSGVVPRPNTTPESRDRCTRSSFIEFQFAELIERKLLSIRISGSPLHQQLHYVTMQYLVLLYLHS